MSQNQISFTRQSDSVVDRAESISVSTFVSKNSDKAVQIVSGLIEKTFSTKVKKLDVGSSISIDLDSLLNDLLINSSGRITRESILDYFKGRKEEIAILYGLTRNISAEKFQTLSTLQIEKLFNLVDSMIERVAICLSARQNSTAGFSASLNELQIFLDLPDLPETFQAKILEAISAQEFDI